MRIQVGVPAPWPARVSTRTRIGLSQFCACWRAAPYLNECHGTTRSSWSAVVTSVAGANRVYAAGEVRFERVEADGRLRDASGRLWRQTAEALELESDGRRLPSVASFRAFWFGWYAQFPDTLLFQ